MSLIDESGYNTIVVHIEGDPGMAYHSFSNRFNKKISPIMWDHFVSECVPDCKTIIKVYNDILVKNDTRRNLLQESMKNTIDSNNKKILKEKKGNMITGLVYLLVASIITAIGIIWSDPHFIVQFATGLMFLTSVGFGWGALDKLLFEGLRLRKKHKIILNLLRAEIVFVPLPPPLLASK